MVSLVRYFAGISREQPVLNKSLRSGAFLDDPEAIYFGAFPSELLNAFEESSPSQTSLYSESS